MEVLAKEEKVDKEEKPDPEEKLVQQEPQVYSDIMLHYIQAENGDLLVYFSCH